MNYRIEADARSWNLSKYRVAGPDSKDPGAETWTPFRYYATLEQAALGLLEQLIIEGAGPDERANTQGIIQACREAAQSVKAALVELEARGVPVRPDGAKGAT